MYIMANLMHGSTIRARFTIRHAWAIAQGRLNVGGGLEKKKNKITADM